MEKKTITITLEQARDLYKNGKVVSLLLTVFKKEELEVEKPNSWDDLKRINGYCISSTSKIEPLESELTDRLHLHKNVFPTKELAEAALALSQLLQLKYHPYWNDGWKPNWENNNEWKHCIGVINNELTVESRVTNQKVLAFQTVDKVNEFLKLYKKLIEQAKPLL